MLLKNLGAFGWLLLASFLAIFIITYATAVSTNWFKSAEITGTITPASVEAGDVNGDGIVDISDVVTAGQAFASYPEHPRWDYRADLNNDDVVDIFDLILIVRNF